MSLMILGEPLFTKDSQGNHVSRIATVFVPTGTLVTLPGVHATQRVAYTDMLNSQRLGAGKPPLSPDEECTAWAGAVDLIIDGKAILIRPDPDNMPLAFEADRLLQDVEGVSKRDIRFLFARDEKVREAIRQRGELWRITPVPQTPLEIERMILSSRIAIRGRPIYYYSTVTGIRYLTAHEFARLGDMADDELRSHVQEIREYAGKRNHIGHRELDFFAVSLESQRGLMSGCDLEHSDAAQVRAWHRATAERFRNVVSVDLRDDAPGDFRWRNLMFSCLTGQEDETVAEEVLRRINPEFFMQIRWLPGGRIENGELVFDTVFSEQERNPDDTELRGLCDETVKGFICNYLREFGHLEYVNIGLVAPTLRRHADAGGHRAYIAEVKHARSREPVVRILRIQKWGIREHLDEGKELLRSIVEAEDYTDFILDRRLGCWQLGMHLPESIITRRISEVYRGANPEYHGTRIWTTYFEREYVQGVATDKIVHSHYKEDWFALEFARLLGEAAAVNLLVGRVTDDAKAMFDDGDEILVMDANGMPLEVVVADHAGTFKDCESDLERFAVDYARPVASRHGLIPEPVRFADAYIGALGRRLSRLQEEYRGKRRAFETLFKHAKQGPGSFAWRWKQGLARLDRTDVPSLARKIGSFCRPAE